MPRELAIRRLARVVQEYHACRFALAFLIAQARRDPTVLGSTHDMETLKVCAAELETTFMTRLFAEFEGAARSFWSSIRTSKPKTEDLLRGIASRAKMPSQTYEDADLVREGRKKVVHHGMSATITLEQAQGRLARFLAYLPFTWTPSEAP